MVFSDTTAHCCLQNSSLLSPPIHVYSEGPTNRKILLYYIVTPIKNTQVRVNINEKNIFTAKNNYQILKQFLL
jgi:hypothetical protein